MGVSPLQGGDWKTLRELIKNEQALTSTLNSSSITDAETLLVAHAINNTGHGIFFYQSNYRQLIKLMTERS